MGGGGREEGTCNDTPLRRHRFSLETRWVKATVLKLIKIQIYLTSYTWAAIAKVCVYLLRTYIHI